MEFYNLKSIIAARKSQIPVQNPTGSFSVCREVVTPFIEPSFSKEGDFLVENCSILLVSAVGASGKTTTAQALSHELEIPILDLAEHKAVGDNSLTGIVTSAYPTDRIGEVLEGLREGTHGIIIDGIDEGRSKTSEASFEAFLDDLFKLSEGAPGVSIVVLGRGQVLVSAWCHLSELSQSVGLLSIDPFDLGKARDYIDAKVPERNAAHEQNYIQVRDAVLKRLGAAFNAENDEKDAFLSFIGYPPVLDAIGDLLRRDPNYHRTEQALSGVEGTSVEVKLLIWICDQLMRREHDDKALPNFIEELAQDAGEALSGELRERLYNFEEQSARVLSRALGKPFRRQLIADDALNQRYEESVEAWCPDHPFLSDRRIRNVVFGAAAVARCILSDEAAYRDLALEYAQEVLPTYHLVHMMDVLAMGNVVDVRCFNMLMQSCSEFVGPNTAISVEIEGASWDSERDNEVAAGELTMCVEFPARGQRRTFEFSGTSQDVRQLTLGPYLVNAAVTLPCGAVLIGKPSLEVLGECSVSCREVRIDAPDLTMRAQSGVAYRVPSLFIDARSVEGHSNTVLLEGGSLDIRCTQHSLNYPLAPHVKIRGEPISDPNLREKYLRLRKILVLFRSHSKGGLARYCDKIDHVRVLKNDTGRRVLDALLNQGVLVARDHFYHIDTERLDEVAGISWHELRTYGTSDKLESFLASI